MANLGAIYLIIIGIVIGVLTLIKPKFFWYHPKANFIKRFLGEKGTTLFYLFLTIIIFSFGIYSFKNSDTENELEKIAIIYQEGKIDEAQNKLLVYTSNSPNDYLAWTILGNIYLDKEMYDKAKSCYDKAIIADPKASEPQSGLASIYTQYGDYEKARDCYLKANELNPNQGSILANLAGVYNNLGDMGKAIELGEKSILLLPESPTLYANLSIYYNKVNQLEKRDKMLNKAKVLGYEDMQSLIDAYEISDDTVN